MPATLRFRDWPMRVKMTVLLVVASLLPLGVATWISIRNAHADQKSSAAALLAARADELVGRIDTFNLGYQRAVRRMALVPDMMDLLLAPPGEAEKRKVVANGILSVWPATDPAVRGVAVLDATGTVVVGTEAGLIGKNLAYRSFVRKALGGAEVTSDVFVAEAEAGGVPTISFLAPMLGPQQQMAGVAVMWVQASALRDLLRMSNGLAGTGSFGTLFDELGIRIAHSFADDLIFHPSRPLPPATVEALVAEHRFGDRTRELLGDVRQVVTDVTVELPAQPEKGAFRAYGPGNQQWNYVVGRRCATVAWAAYYVLPESVLDAELARMVRQKMLFAAAIMLAALAVGGLFAARILQPIRRLSAAARALGAGDSAVRVRIDRKDELGELGASFNSMAARLEEQAAALVRESEAQYRKLFEAMNEGFCTIEVIFDDHSEAVDYRFLEANAAFDRQTGLREVRGRRLSELFPEPEMDWVKRFGRVALTGEPLDIEGESKAIGRHFSVRAYRMGGPQERRVAVLFNDVTDRLESQRKLRTQLERLDLLQQITRAIGERHDLASIYQVVARTLEDRLPLDFGCIFRYEPAGDRLVVACIGLRSLPVAVDLGLTEEAPVELEDGLSLCLAGQLVYEPDLTQTAQAFPQRLAGAGLHALVAAPLLVESQVFGILIAARRKTGSFNSGDCEFLRQLSEHVALAAHQAQLHSALQTAYDDLRQTQLAALQQERLRALGQMASGIAHDINNAISPAALYTDSLLEREKSLSPQGRAQLQTIQCAVHDVAATVARMREFYRQREPQLMLVAVHLNGLVPQVVELTRARWSDMPQRRGITIELRLELEEELPPIMAAENEIREALINLIFNAVDAMPSGGTLLLRTRAAPVGRVLVEVSDTGVGMDEEARRHCLEPFFTTKGERGTGLGLAMVYGMLQRHRAEIEIDSAVGRGTTVRMSFAAAPEAGVVVEPLAKPFPRGLRLLVIDDDPLLLQSLRDTLESDGHVVVIANGGAEGIELFAEALRGGRLFSAVLTDLGMPYVDGRQVAAMMKELSPATPVIMLTGWGQRLVAQGEVPANVDLVLSKPPRLRDLREALASCCGEA
ncbi:MAG TPA: ATP-binding protein [Steroidobacteraceae bacterium]|nr:ATP-binding protein [Steroidobacteraceae bacterium]